MPRVRIPRCLQTWAKECITWPRYCDGVFKMIHSGESMLELTEQEQSALAIVLLLTTHAREGYGARHQFNWKKTGLSRAYFKGELVEESRMPTRRAAAAYRWLVVHNKYYEYFQRMQRSIMERGVSMNISSFDLFILRNGIAVFIVSRKACALRYWRFRFN